MQHAQRISTVISLCSINSWLQYILCMHLPLLLAMGFVIAVSICAVVLGLGADVEASCLVADSGSFDYGHALGKAIMFFEGQRSGKLPPNQRVKWRGDSALSDGRQENVKLVGGYYDAGDNVKFVWPMSFSISLLSFAASEYKSQISRAGQLGYLHTAIRWGADFILRAHSSPTTLYTQVGDGNSDHQCWERPEDMDTPRTLFKITSTSPGSEAAADASAALASASIVFKSDSNYSSRLLKSSILLFEFANEYRGSYQGSCPFYCSYSGYQDELLWAAAWLFKATGDNKYLEFVIDSSGWSEGVSEFSWDNKLVGVQALLAKEYMSGRKSLIKYKTDADSFVCSLMPGSGSVQIQTTSGGLLFTSDTVNLQYVASASMMLLHYSNTLKSAGISGVNCSAKTFSTSEITKFAKSQVDYILGKNPAGYSYMVGFSKKYPKRVHHRGSSIPSIKVVPRKVGCNEGFSTWYSTNSSNPNTHVGAIVGGPDSQDQFKDARSDSSHLEPTTYINAAAVGALAALLSEQGCLQQMPSLNETVNMIS